MWDNENWIRSFEIYLMRPSSQSFEYIATTHFRDNQPGLIPIRVNSEEINLKRFNF